LKSISEIVEIWYLIGPPGKIKNFDEAVHII